MSLSQTTGQLNVNNNFVRNILNPVLALDGATKNYVDSSITGINLYSAGSASLITPGGGSGPNFLLDGLVAGSNIAISTTGTALIIYSTGNVSLINTGTGLFGGPISTSGTLSLIVPVSIANGGTNSTTALNGTGIMISNGSSIVQGPTGSVTTVLHGGVTGPFYAPVTLTTDVTGILPVVNGGTGSAAYNPGQVLIGNNAGGLSANTLTAGTGITIVNGNGTITISASSSGIYSQIFTGGSGIWPIPSNTSLLRFTLIGAGGAGGNGIVGSASNRGGGGGGGGAGAFIYNYPVLATPGYTSVVYNVGIGGASGVSATNTTVLIGTNYLTAVSGLNGATGLGGGVDGGAGGSGGGTGLTVGSPTNLGIFNAPGGAGGASASGTGFAGGLGTVSFFILSGGGGGSGGAVGSILGSANGGTGAASLMNYPGGTFGIAQGKGGGGGGAGGWGGAGGAGGAGTGMNGGSYVLDNTGAGGGGGGGSATGSPALGGAGASGMVLIEYY